MRVLVGGGVGWVVGRGFGSARGSRREKGWVVVGLGRVEEVAGAGMVVVAAQQPKTTTNTASVGVGVGVVVGGGGCVGCVCVSARAAACLRRAYASGRHALCACRVLVGRVGGLGLGSDSNIRTHVKGVKTRQGLLVGFRHAPVAVRWQGRGVGRLGTAGGAVTEVPGHL